MVGECMQRGGNAVLGMRLYVEYTALSLRVLTKDVGPGLTRCVIIERMLTLQCNNPVIWVK
jgi:hypothetical protein